jgi:hypothetical protein
MSPKGSCVAGLFPKVVLLEAGGTFKRWGLVGGPEVIWNMPWKVIA